MPADTRRHRRSGRSERGQSTAFVATMMFVMMLFVAVVANVGQAVNRRMALQVIADTGAFTGASKMAVHMNQLAYWNMWLQRLWAGFSWPMTIGGATAVNGYGGWFWPGCEVADVIEPLYYTAWYTVAWGAVRGPNLLSVSLPYEEAKRVTDYNAMDLFPGEQLLPPKEWSLSLGIPPQRPLGQLVSLEHVEDGWPPAATWALAPGRPHVVYTCTYDTSLGLVWRVRHENYPHWYRKADTNPYAFVWIVTAPSTRAFLFDNFFSRFVNVFCADGQTSGCGLIPPMTAAAAAKPVGGSIEDGEATYVAKLIPLGQLNGYWGFAADSLYDRGVRKVTH